MSHTVYTSNLISETISSSCNLKTHDIPHQPAQLRRRMAGILPGSVRSSFLPYENASNALSLHKGRIAKVLVLNSNTFNKQFCPLVTFK